MLAWDWIDRWASIEPERTALVDLDRNQRWDYAALRLEIQRATAWLRSEGVEPGDRVGILAKNRREHVVLFYATVRLGGILLPLNWRLSAPEIDFVLEDSEPKLLLVEEPFSVAITGLKREFIPLEDTPPWSDLAPSGFVEESLKPEDPAMILYTSGTTGRPKGAVLTHGSIAANSIQTTLSWDLSGQDSTLTHTPFFHTGGWNVLTTPLFHRGGKVVITGGFSPEATLKCIEDESITLLFAVPTMWERILQVKGSDQVDLSSLRFAISGGAPCPQHISEAYLARGIQFKQGYGMTEVGPNCFVISLTDAAKKPNSVGVPIHGQTIRIVDEEGNDVGPGEVGELWLSGPHVFGGYFRRPEATQDALVDGWFRSGDLVRQDEDGHTFIVGRRKEMFISGGENVYPAEVERVLLEHPAVAQAAVVALPHPEWGEVGRAFLVLEDGQDDPGFDSFKAHCKAALAGYKVPKRFEVLPEMPLTATGKIAKKELTDRPVE